MYHSSTVMTPSSVIVVLPISLPIAPPLLASSLGLRSAADLSDCRV
jgi:hypothetical protein